MAPTTRREKTLYIITKATHQYCVIADGQRRLGADLTPLSEDVPVSWQPRPLAMSKVDHLSEGHLGRLPTARTSRMHQQYIADIEASGKRRWPRSTRVPYS